MKSLEDQLSSYAAYHRDQRNIATHFVGITLIVVAVNVLLSRPALTIAGLSLSPACLVSAMAALYYLRLDLRLASLMTILLTLTTWFGAWAAALRTPTWLALGIGGFVVGWAFQFVGHYWERRKPAFVDDLMGLVIGPLFVLVEVLFAAGLCKDLQRTIEARSGQVRGRAARTG